MKTYIIDLETGGLDAEKNGICSISIKELDSNEKPKTIFISPTPGKVYEQQALDINGLKLKDLDACGTIAQACDHLLLHYFQDKMITLIGHNIKFDVAFLLQAFKESRCPMPALHTICTQQLAKKKTLGLINHKLITIYRHFGGDEEIINNAHIGKYDVIMTESIYNALKNG